MTTIYMKYHVFCLRKLDHKTPGVSDIDQRGGMAQRDYYEVLELAQDCIADDIKKAYRKAALRWFVEPRS